MTIVIGICFRLLNIMKEVLKIKPDYSIRVLARTAEVLNCFTRTEPEKSLIQITAETGLHKSTVFRILDTLEQLKWVRRSPKTGFYRLGYDLFELGFRAVQGMDFYKISRPHLENLVKLTRQSVHLAIHDNGEALYINKVESPGSIITQPSQIGLRLPMHCTAVGKVLLCDMSREEAEAILAKQGMNKITPNTIDRPEELFRVLAETRAQGYALDDEEIQIGLRCVAAPIKDFNGRVVAAVSVSGLAANFSKERLPFYVNAVMQTVNFISNDLGYRDPLAPLRSSRV